MRRWARLILALVLVAAGALSLSGQQAATAPPAPPSPSGSASLAKATPPDPATSNADFIKAADEVLQQMSKLLDLPIKEPLKKSLRSKQEVRDYLVREEKKTARQRALRRRQNSRSLRPYPEGLSARLIHARCPHRPGRRPLRSQGQRVLHRRLDSASTSRNRVMSHELTHALEDQSFHIDPWIKAARPNDDAELARDAVSEGSAIAAMVDYEMLDQNVGVRDTSRRHAHDPHRRSFRNGQRSQPLESAAYTFAIELLFPYLAGTGFTQAFLKAHSGWGDLHDGFRQAARLNSADHPSRSLSARCHASDREAARLEGYCAARLETARRKCYGRVRPE